MRRCSPLLLAAIAVVLTAGLAGSPAAQSKKPAAAKKVKKQFHESLFYEYTADKSKWRDLGKTGLGIKYQDLGPVVILYSQYFETPGGSSNGTYKIGNQSVSPTSHAVLCKAMMKETADGFKKVFKEGKSKKFKCKAGKGAYIDLIAKTPEGERARNLTEFFTSSASGVDVSRPYDPKTIKVHYRWIAVKQKEGVHLLVMMATEGVLKKQKKDINKILKGLTAE